MPDSPGLQTYKWALLVAKYRVMPAEIAGLTDAQMDELLFYPRDQDGVLKEPDFTPVVPPGGPTKQTRLAQILQLQATGIITPERARELCDEVNRAAAD